MKKIIIFIFVFFNLSILMYSSNNMIFKNITVNELKKIDTKKEFVLLDLRTPPELKSGYLKGAINIDFYSSDFIKKLDDLDKSKKYIIYCRSGNRSGRAMKIMKNLKFKEVYNIIGGMQALKKQNYFLIVY